MKAVLCTFAAVVAGLLVLLMLAVAVELFSAVVHPLPEDFGGTTVLNVSMLPYPAWFKVANLLAIPAAAFAGGRLSRNPKTTGTGEGTERRGNGDGGPGEGNLGA